MTSPFDVIDDGCQPILEKQFLLAWPKRAEAQYRRFDPSLADLDALFGNGHAEPVDTVCFQPSGTFNSPMSVSVRFDHGHVFHIGSDEGASRVKIEGKSVKIDDRFGWALSDTVTHRVCGDALRDACNILFLQGLSRRLR